MRVDFVVAPFGPPQYPSLGVSNLTAIVKEAGHSSKVHYENLRFSDALGCTVYDWIGPRPLNQQLLLGDFLFALLRTPREGREDAMDRFLRGPMSYYVSEEPRLLADLRSRILTRILPILEEASLAAVERLLERDPDVLGFTLGAFQSGASLHLAGLIRGRKPGIRIWFGGHSCMGSIGYAYLRSFPVLDAVFSGESESALREALARMVRGEGLTGIASVLTREAMDAGGFTVPGDDVPEGVRDLDSLPVPDFQDYFESFAACRSAPRVRPHLLLESSRGCWWRERGPCRFCGLEVHSKGFRSKSSERLFREFTGLIERHGIRDIQMVDSVLDPRYCTTLFPVLSERGPKVNLCYEIRSNLTRAQMAAMRKGGVEVVQAGVEALDDELLSLLRKGCRTVENLRVIKWCEELGIKLIYNLLFAIPGETTGCYERVLQRMALLHHLRPPSPAPIRVDRYSEYHRDPGRFRIQIRGSWSEAMRHCYPEPGADIEGLTYHFGAAFLEPGSGHADWWIRLLDAIREWKKDYYEREKRLFRRNVNGRVFVEDNRFSAHVQTSELSPVQAWMLDACDSAIRPINLRGSGPDVGASDLETAEALDFLLEKRFVLRVGEEVLSLAVRTNQWPTDLSDRNEGSFLRRSVEGVREAKEEGEDPDVRDFSRLMRRLTALSRRRQRHLLRTRENRERTSIVSDPVL